ncbi:hypothetical protein QUF75_18305 [Desulfococcaceae bacterium HSG7]|nr:hypothetical protein [Desulfococcaceae bacterium HSG7]
MTDVYCFAYVEDAPSAAIAHKLVKTRNVRLGHRLIFRNGFPAVMGGYGAIKSKCKAFLNMARAGSHTFILTDLDTAECACALIRDWFAISQSDTVDLPSQCIFRVAVREIESWILADHVAWAEYIGIPAANFSMNPDQLDAPKKHLLNVIRRKGTKKIHREMLPQGSAHIGPRYNEVLCDFVDKSWVPERAAEKSPSLDRALKALMEV